MDNDTDERHILSTLPDKHLDLLCGGSMPFFDFGRSENLGKEYLSERAKSKNENIELIGKIESARDELNGLIRAEGMESERVLELSRDLDKMILECYGERH